MLLDLYCRRPLLRNIMIPLLFALTFLMVFTGHAHAKDITPTGIGDLMPSPTKVPAGQGTLYETYSDPNTWQLDTDYGMSDVLDPMLEGIADICMGLTTVIGAAAVVVVQWIFQLTSIPALENAISKAIGGAATGLSETLLPSALVVGALIAFAQHKRGSGMSQLAWVFVSGIVSVSLLTSPSTWVNGVDSARTVGANVTLNATAAGLGDGTSNFPFKLGHDPKWTGNSRDDMLRKSGDSVWRAYVATPWCVANFGSIEVCQKYATTILDKGSDMDARKSYLQDHATEDAIGKQSVKWRQGHSPVGRIMVTVPALISVVIFTVLVLILAFASLASLIGALMLLLTGVLFACLWVIPGKPRQWGLSWFDRLLGYTLESTIASLTLGAVLCVQVATTQMFGVYGWLPSMGLSIAAAIVGVKFRGVVAQIFGVSTGGSSMLGGLLAAQLLGKAGRVLTGGRKRDSGMDHQPVRTLDPNAGGGGAPGGSLPRQRPPAPPPLPAGHYPGPALPAGQRRTPAGLPPGKGGTGSGTYHRPGAPGGSGGPAPAGLPGPIPAGPPRGAEAPVVTLDRLDQDGAGTPTTARPPVSGRAARPALPAGAPTRQTASGSTTTRPTAASTPTSTLRPEKGATPNYAFRQAPPLPAAGQPKIIQGTVIRSTPNGPPPRPTNPTAPARSTAPSSRPVTPPAATAPRPLPAPRSNNKNQG